MSSVTICGDMNTKEVTVLSWEEFAIHADEIERRRRIESEGYKNLLLPVDNYSHQKMGTSLQLIA